MILKTSISVFGWKKILAVEEGNDSCVSTRNSNNSAESQKERRSLHFIGGSIGNGTCILSCLVGCF